MTTLEDWTAHVARELAIDDAVDLSTATRTVLDVARDVAHGVDRPAAPMTAYLLGIAAARGGDIPASTAELAARVSELVKQWPAPSGS
ncbi:MAG: DUF6457 domain-containing protein [Mycobacteriales bacterium]